MRRDVDFDQLLNHVYLVLTVEQTHCALKEARRHNVQGTCLGIQLLRSNGREPACFGFCHQDIKLTEFVMNESSFIVPDVDQKVKFVEAPEYVPAIIIIVLVCFRTPLAAYVVMLCFFAVSVVMQPRMAKMIMKDPRGTQHCRLRSRSLH